ncbi:putative protein TPRXL [Lucilia cuprina]|uniref:putative protein TPRXL n=1 Tax=Lucilia cuprina TaxID=7375 RepID=UPI001F0615B1|nr:putative protein TPRXL [Lucilia cuprina]
MCSNTSTTTTTGTNKSTMSLPTIVANATGIPQFSTATITTPTTLLSTSNDNLSFNNLSTLPLFLTPPPPPSSSTSPIGVNIKSFLQPSSSSSHHSPSSSPLNMSTSAPTTNAGFLTPNPFLISNSPSPPSRYDRRSKSPATSVSSSQPYNHLPHHQHVQK